jgi:hypothetical protein
MVYGRSVQFDPQRSVVRSVFAFHVRKVGVLFYVVKHSNKLEVSDTVHLFSMDERKPI